MQRPAQLLTVLSSCAAAAAAAGAAGAAAAANAGAAGASASAVPPMGFVRRTIFVRWLLSLALTELMDDARRTHGTPSPAAV
jgi:hypothetical protein